LASPTRRRILDLLRQGARTTGELAALFPEVSRYAVMQHLRVLEAADLVVPRRQGRYRHNHLNPVPIERIARRWIGPYRDSWSAALATVREEVEGDAAPRRPL
jgi:DNA-binding transcriptional ArsR family regulator